ncbi:uncharacterized protein LOC126055535 [Helicoverpa armigera]|uniref:uncharacterized protein LOC126055535 n=1 Tax=Helicoverpa armigera TaxID=29058 RepID=UPI00308361A9
MPKTLKSGERIMVLKVKEFCEREKRNEAPIIPLRCVQARVAAITGISEKTVSKEGKEAASTSKKVTTPRKSGLRRKTHELDDFERCAIRHKIHEFYSVRKELPSLAKLLHEMRKEINYKGSRTTLWRIIKGMGFYFKKCKSKRKVLMETYDIVAWRHRYLEELRNNRLGTQRPVVYLDETYIHATYCAGKCWQSETEEGVLSSDSKGPRWIIVHAGGTMGFISNAQLIFRSQSKSADYHDEMNKVNFNKWLKEKLIPNLHTSTVHCGYG